VSLELVLDAVLDNRELFEHIFSPEAPGGLIGRTIERFGLEIAKQVRIVRPRWPAWRVDLMGMSIGGALVGGLVHHLRGEVELSAHTLSAELLRAVPDWLYEPPDTSQDLDSDHLVDQTAARDTRDDS
jgi:hypothetical protein